MARGICQYATHNATDSWTTSKPFGLCTGVKFATGPAAQHVQGLGDDDEIVGGLVKPAFSAEFLPCDADLIELSARATTGYPCSALTEFYARIGAGFDYLYTGCKVDKLALSCAVEKFLQGKLDVAALSRTQSALAKPTGIAARRKPFLWHKSTACTVGGADYQIEAWEVVRANNVAHDTDLNGPGVMPAGPKRLVEGDEAVTLELTLKQELPESVTGTYGSDILTNIAFSTTLRSVLNDQLTVAVAAMALFKGDLQAEPGGKVQTFRYSFEAKLNSNPLTTTYTQGG